MKKSKYIVLFLLVTVICLASINIVFAGDLCTSCCMYPDPESKGWQEACSGCSCGSGSSSSASSEPVIYIRPEDSKGRQFYIDENGIQRNVAYRNWSDCMEDFGDSEKCSKIVTNECEACLGSYQEMVLNGWIVSRPCSELCKYECVSTSAYTGKGSAGEDDNGSWYVENGQKKYSYFNNFNGCLAVMGDIKYCVDYYDYGCNYTDRFFTSHLCAVNDSDCQNRVLLEYIMTCP